MVYPHTWIKLARDRAWGKQDRRCAYCHGELARADATGDHIVPRRDGGSDRVGNIAAACGLCNLAKGSMAAGAFRRLLKGHDPAPFRILLCRVIRRINLEGDRAVKRVLVFGGVG